MHTLFVAHVLTAQATGSASLAPGELILLMLGLLGHLTKVRLAQSFLSTSHTILGLVAATGCYFVHVIGTWGLSRYAYISSLKRLLFFVILALILVIAPVLPAFLARRLLTRMVAVLRDVLLALMLTLMASLGRRPASRHTTRGDLFTTWCYTGGASTTKILLAVT